jgi:hypothetical protein
MKNYQKELIYLKAGYMKSNNAINGLQSRIDLIEKKHSMIAEQTKTRSDLEFVTKYFSTKVIDPADINRINEIKSRSGGLAKFLLSIILQK